MYLLHILNAIETIFIFFLAIFDHLSKILLYQNDSKMKQRWSQQRKKIKFAGIKMQECAFIEIPLNVLTLQEPHKISHIRYLEHNW